jgi:hypothetical protein
VCGVGVRGEGGGAMGGCGWVGASRRACHGQGALRLLRVLTVVGRGGRGDVRVLKLNT